MEIREDLIWHHQFVHGMNFWKKLTEAQLRVCPQDKVNSVVWLLWHTARTEDLIVNTLIREAADVLSQDDWTHAKRSNGTDDTKAEVQEFSDSVEIDAVHDYRRQVLDETQNWLAQIDLSLLDRQVVGVADKLAANAEAIRSGSEGWMSKFWEGMTVHKLFGQFVIGHTYQHLGQTRLHPILLS